MHVLSTLVLASAGLASSYELPAKLEQIYKEHKTGECKNILGSGFNNGDSSANNVVYCGDIEGAIFLHSTANGGSYADMDVDCDGADNSSGACSNDPSGQGVTAFQSEVSKYGISDLNANIHPYVVFGNEDSNPQFAPNKFGMEPLSVMAVVCNGQLHYGIWGDTNGGTATGEAAISTAELCFPNAGITGDNGHTPRDVLYIGFKGKEAFPGAKADWKAKNTKAFEESIRPIGDRLVAKLGTGTSPVLTSSASSGTPIASPTWTPSSSWSAPPGPPTRYWRRNMRA
ncbi:Fungal chitosanase [Penicillium riverlandense]|uniref:Fungal chitosanase n=1 Tax=Penicillium riverlandense TaxID=1903569 RepID=UPI0025475E2A|nr:Fungal chitosanase [Penicillium riverlandense]KAJ5806709.1 Fungal chitosanase [Penicillium riverlandense]